MDGFSWPQELPDWADARESVEEIALALAHSACTAAAILRNPFRPQVQLKPKPVNSTMALVLASVPAALGAWVFAANLMSNSSQVIIPREIQAVLQWLGGLR